MIHISNEDGTLSNQDIAKDLDPSVLDPSVKYNDSRQYDMKSLTEHNPMFSPNSVKLKMSGNNPETAYQT